jgi:hypothetical protein
MVFNIARCTCQLVNVEQVDDFAHIGYLSMRLLHLPQLVGIVHEPIHKDSMIHDLDTDVQWSSRGARLQPNWTPLRTCSSVKAARWWAVNSAS